MDATDINIANTKRLIINEIRRTAEKNSGVPLGMIRFYQATGIKISDWRGKLWLRWSDVLRAAQHDEALLHKLQRHVQTTLDGSAGNWRRNTQAQALWTLATFIAAGLSQGHTLQDVMEPLVAMFAS